MGKKNGTTSWLTAVKRAFRSPSKENKDKKSCRRTEQHEHDKEEEDEEKRGKKSGWLFRKTETKARRVCNNLESAAEMNLKMEVGQDQEMHAMAVAAATAAAASAAATAKMVKITTPPPGFIIHHWAAIVIQTAYRGYLARKALRALKGIVKLQALVRGHNVRQQAKLTLQCMQALVRVQEKVLNSRMSQESRRNSMFSESNILWDSKSLQDIRSRRSLSREMNCCTDNEWDGHEETESVLQKKLEAALKREKALAYAFSNQIRRGSRWKTSVGEERELFQKPNWLDRWMATKQWDDTLSSDASIKTVQMDNTLATPYSNSRRISLNRESSPPKTPPSAAGARSRVMGVRSASPRCSVREERCYSAAQTPCLRSKTLLMPNYMIATESAKARARPQSTPRQRPGTPDRERSSGFSVKKRLHYPEGQIEDDGLGGYNHNFKNSSLKSSFSGNYGAENELSDYSSSCYGLRGEISPCSTTDLRWLK